MSRPLLISALILMLGTGALAQGTAPAAQKPGVRKHMPAKPKAGKTQKEAEAEVPTPPPTPEQMPPSAPQVSFTGGQLVINAQNSTLADVLAAVRRQTGATVEVPPGAQSERVFARIGPGSPHDVLAQLLDGSKFDYIVLAAPDRPNAIQYVKVTPKRGGPPTPPSAVAASRPAPPQPEDEEIIDEEIPDESTVVEEPVEEQPQPGQQVAPGQPVPVQPGQVQPGQPAQPGQQQEGVKSPEQLLEELRRLQQMQQEQIQQQLNPANRIPPDNQQQQPNDPNNPDRNPPENEQPE